MVNHSMYDKENYFDLFSILESVDIDQKKLDDNFLKLQNLIHPDKLIAKDSLERIVAAEFSAKINRAYDILNDNKKRAEYLLYLKGIVINQEEGNNINADPVMLNEILEMNENPEQYNLEQIKNVCYEKFKDFYTNGNYKAAAQCIIKLQYVSKLIKH